MDLRPRFARWALSRPHVLLVDPPGSRTLRWQVEAELDRRGWLVANSPADADLLLVLGEPGPQLAAAIDVLWSQIPGPRHRHDLRNAHGLGAQFDSALTSLFQAPEDRSHEDQQVFLQGQGQTGPQDAEHRGGHMEHGGGHDHRADHDTGDTRQHAGHDEHEGQGGHRDHHMHHGGVVAGLPMASTAPDRDGLELDALQVSLGPVLPGWPTGLVLTGSLHGDVLTGAEVSWLDPRPGGSSHEPESAAALDSLARFLQVAGWPLAVRRACAARDYLLAADEGAAQRGRDTAARLARTVRRSRMLRWSVRGIGAAGDGDVLDRVYRWCDAAAGLHGTRLSRNVVSVDDLSALVDGQELAAVRLIVASVDVAAVSAQGHHGMHHA